MKKALTAAALAVVVNTVSAPALAQGYTTLGVEARLSTPSGELGDWHQTGVGAGINAEYDLSVNWRATGRANLSYFGGKGIRGIPGTAPDLRVYGASAGVSAFIGTTPLHLGAEVGMYWYESPREHYSNAGLRRDFGVLPSIGYRSGTFDTTLQYKVGGDAQWVEVRASMQLLRF
jgi:hypothetical protein